VSAPHTSLLCRVENKIYESGDLGIDCDEFLNALGEASYTNRNIQCFEAKPEGLFVRMHLDFSFPRESTPFTKNVVLIIRGRALDIVVCFKN